MTPKAARRPRWSGGKSRGCRTLGRGVGGDVEIVETEEFIGTHPSAKYAACP